MDTEAYNEFKLKPAKNGWTVRSFSEVSVYTSDSQVIDALKEHMKQIRAETARPKDATGQRPSRL